MLDGTVDAEDDWHMVLIDGEARVGVQLAPGRVPPDWPNGGPPPHLHLTCGSMTSRRLMTKSCHRVPGFEGRRPTSSLPTFSGLRGSGRASFCPVLGQTLTTSANGSDFAPEFGSSILSQ